MVTMRVVMRLAEAQQEGTHESGVQPADHPFHAPLSASAASFTSTHTTVSHTTHTPIPSTALCSDCTLWTLKPKFMISPPPIPLSTVTSESMCTMSHMTGSLVVRICPVRAKINPL